MVTRRILLAGLLLAGLAFPSTARRATTAELADRADNICHVVCRSRTCAIDPRTRIVFTTYEFRIAEDIKGASGAAAVTLRVPGGRAAGVVTRVPGAVRFRTGAHYVVFLGRASRVLAGGTFGLVREADERWSLEARPTGFADLDRLRRVRLADFVTAVRKRVEAATGKEGR